MKTFGSLVRKTRLARGQTAADLARQCKISRIYLQQIEAGRRPAPEIFPSTLRIIKALGVSYGTEEFRALLVAAWNERVRHGNIASRNRKDPNSDEFQEFEHFLSSLLWLVSPEGIPSEDRQLAATTRLQPVLDEVERAVPGFGNPADPVSMSYPAIDRLQAVQIAAQVLGDKPTACAIQIFSTDGSSDRIIFPPEESRELSARFEELARAPENQNVPLDQLIELAKRDVGVANSDAAGVKKIRRRKKTA